MIRWGLMGAGAIAGKRVASALAASRGSRLDAVCDVNQDSASALAGQYGIGRVHTDPEHLFSDRELDALYIATPVCHHAPQALAALEAGKHVLVEKPMALTVADGEALVATARRRGLTLSVAYYRRFFPSIQRAAQLIADGVLGRIVMVVSVYHTWYAPPPQSWRVNPQEAGGGVLWDMGSHRFDLLTALLGQPQKVWATTATLAHAYQVEDTATVCLQFEGGAQGTTMWGWSSQTWQDSLAIVGTDGKLVWDPVDGPGLTVYRGHGRTQDRADEVHPLPSNVHQPLVQDFVDALEAGHDPLVTGEEGLKTSRVLDGVTRSVQSGCAVNL